MGTPLSALLDRFQLRQRGTTVRTEALAGLSTFAAMAYILAVNPALLGQAGLDRGAVLAATALASALFTVAMGLYANLPIALAPGMGLNAFFTFTLCIEGGLPWPAALGLVFYGGLLFLILSLTGLRQAVLDAIPEPLRAAIGCGIGFFIAFIGLQKGGLVVAHPATLVTLGKVGSPSVLLVLGGLLLAAVLIRKKVPDAILLTVALLTVAGMFVKGPDGAPLTAWPAAPVSAPPSLAPVWLKLDLCYFWVHLGQCLPYLFTLLFVSLFDGLGTLVGLTRRFHWLKPKEERAAVERALRADALATAGCALLGTSTVTAYIESAAGIEQGGRTGLASLVTALCFLLALFFAPLLLAVPAAATAPILILVGVLMMEGIGRIDFKDPAAAVPAVLIVLLMPLTFSIAEGLSLGLIAHAALKIATGKGRELSPTLLGLTGLLLLHYVWR